MASGAPIRSGGTISAWPGFLAPPLLQIIQPHTTTAPMRINAPFCLRENSGVRAAIAERVRSPSTWAASLTDAVP